MNSYKTLHLTDRSCQTWHRSIYIHSYDFVVTVTILFLQAGSDIEEEMVEMGSAADSDEEEQPLAKVRHKQVPRALQGLGKP